MLLQSGGDVALALTHAEAAVSLASTNPAYLDTLALALFRVGRHDEACKTVEKGLEIAASERYLVNRAQQTCQR